MLIAFPIAFLCGALVADAVALLSGWERAGVFGATLNLAAIATGLVAAVPGLVDYFTVVPPSSSGKQRATYHMLVNGSALVAFALSWLFRDRETWQPGFGTLLLEAAGVGLIVCGGWLGGTLVYRNQIGVDHRYANAGKWREASVPTAPAGPVVVARADELKPGQMKLLHVGGRRVVLARVDDGHVAFDDHCPHRGGPLSDGVLARNTVTCPWHGSQFDVRSGSVQSGPAKDGIATYPVEESGGEVRLTLPG
jgi:nitrite reductase/ring-hydroxylating ferredoxin subunit/uncharacterized membrane protein